MLIKHGFCSLKSFSKLLLSLLKCQNNIWGLKNKLIFSSTMVVNGIVSYVGNPDENGLYNATILVRKTWAKKNDEIKDNVVLRLGPFGTDKKCPSVKERLEFLISNYWISSWKFNLIKKERKISKAKFMSKYFHPDYAQAAKTWAKYSELLF